MLIEWNIFVQIAVNMLLCGGGLFKVSTSRRDLVIQNAPFSQGGSWILSSITNTHKSTFGLLAAMHSALHSFWYYLPIRVDTILKFHRALSNHPGYWNFVLIFHIIFVLHNIIFFQKRVTFYFINLHETFWVL